MKLPNSFLPVKQWACLLLRLSQTRDQIRKNFDQILNKVKLTSAVLSVLSLAGVERLDLVVNLLLTRFLKPDL